MFGGYAEGLEMLGGMIALGWAYSWKLRLQASGAFA